MSILLSFVIVFGLAFIVSLPTYLIRRVFIRNCDQANRFLEKHFNTFSNRGLFTDKHHDYIDRDIIKRWGKNGVNFLWLPVMIPQFEFTSVASGNELFESLILVSHLSSLILILFASFSFSHAALGLWALKKLQLVHYHKTA